MRSFRKAVLFVGIPVSAVLMAGSAAIATVRDLTPVMYCICGAFSLMAGGFSAALCHCRYRRHKGLWSGLLCGTAVTAFWFGVAWMVGGSIGCSPTVLWGMLGGICGGVWGVNLPAPVSSGQSHRGMHMRQQLQTAADAYQKRRYRRPWQPSENSTRAESSEDA